MQINRTKAVIMNTDAGLNNINHIHAYILIHEFANIALLQEIYLTCGNPCLYCVKSIFFLGGGGCSVTFYQ